MRPSATPLAVRITSDQAYQLIQEQVPNGQQAHAEHTRVRSQEARLLVLDGSAILTFDKGFWWLTDRPACLGASRSFLGRQRNQPRRN